MSAYRTVWTNRSLPVGAVGDYDEYWELARAAKRLAMLVLQSDFYVSAKSETDDVLDALGMTKQ